MNISGTSMANVGYMWCLPMGISNYGGDLQIFNVPDHITNSQPQIIFNPMAQAALAPIGGGCSIPTPNFQSDINGVISWALGPVYANFASSVTQSNAQRVAALEKKIQNLQGEETGNAQSEFDAIKAEIEQLENSGLSNQEILQKGREIEKSIAALENTVKNLDEPQGAGDDEEISTDEIDGTDTVNTAGENGRAELSSDDYGPEFLEKVKKIAENINCDYRDLLGLMNSESGIDASAKNPNGSASGLIQFIESTARSLGTTTAAIRRMDPIDQLDYVEKCILNSKKSAGFSDSHKLSAGELYALIFLPARAQNEVLTRAGEKYYSQNIGLDTNKDGKITKSEIGQRVIDKRVSDMSFYA